MQPSDPRAVRTRNRVLEATVTLLAERGVEAMTMDAVATAAGVSRSTLYRHWPDRLPLLVDAIAHLGDQINEQVADHDDPQETLDTALHRVIGSLGAGLRSPVWGRIAGSLAVAAEHDTALAQVYRDYVLSRRERVAAVLRRAQQRGELANSVDVDWAVSLLAGPLYYHRLVLHQPLDEREIRRHVHDTLTLLLAADFGTETERREPAREGDERP